MVSVLQIKACSLLSIMLLVLIHNAFPHTHLHNEEDNTFVSLEEGHHHDNHHHHHHPHLPEDKDEEGFLDILLKGHSHSTPIHHYTLTPIDGLGYSKIFIANLLLDAVDPKIILRSFDPERNKYALFKDPLGRSRHLSKPHHRGPPALG